MVSESSFEMTSNLIFGNSFKSLVLKDVTLANNHFIEEGHNIQSSLFFSNIFSIE